MYDVDEIFVVFRMGDEDPVSYHASAESARARVNQLYAEYVSESVQTDPNKDLLTLNAFAWFITAPLE